MLQTGTTQRGDAPWEDLLRGRTYLNIAYLLLGFPLGLMYFVVLISGTTLGLGLSLTLLGLPVLLCTVGLVWAFTWLEREAAALVLGIETLGGGQQAVLEGDLSGQDGSSAPSGKADSTPDLARRVWGSALWSYVSSPMFWRGLALLLIRFPLGLLGFAVTVALLSVTLALLGMPFYYSWADGWQPNFLGVLGLALVGLGVGILSLRVLNLLAEAMARLVYALVGDSRSSKSGGSSLRTKGKAKL